MRCIFGMPNLFWKSICETGSNILYPPALLTPKKIVAKVVQSTRMEITNTKTLFEMFPRIDVEKLEKLFDEPDYKTYMNLIKVSQQLRERKDVADINAAFLSAYSQVVELLTKKLESLGYTQTEISAAMMIENGLIK